MLRTLVLSLIALGLTGCTLLRPLPEARSLSERLAAFPTVGLPLAAPAIVRWNDYQIPFIEAGSEEDAAFVLGLVHAHLRLAQIELLRRTAYGRLAEAVGPFATDLDHSLRALDLPRAAPAIEAALPEPTRRWLLRFAAGLNHYQQRMAELPHEFALLGLRPEPFTVRDLIAMGRLAAFDVNWLLWRNLWPLRQRADWPVLWREIVSERSGSAALPTGDGAIGSVLSSVGRSGSNAVAVAGSRTESGSGLLYNDTHLGLALPNSWLIVGLHSPSMHAVGLMIPGLPFIAVGRNEEIAWGGANLRAASSTLYDVSDLPPSMIRSRRETIRVRGWFDRNIVLHDSAWGPILSDSPLLEARDGERIALRWIGHDASDEFSAMLALNRARNFDEFRDAFDGFAVSGQAMLYADRQGNIGQLMAVRLPRRGHGLPGDIVLKPQSDGTDWSNLVGAAGLPVTYNPPDGLLAAANGVPGPSPVPIGYLFSPRDRTERARALVEANNPLGPEDIPAFAADVLAPSALTIKRLLLGAIGRSGLSASDAPPVSAALNALKAWDGRYEEQSRGALIFELVLRQLAEHLFADRMPWEDAERFLNAANLPSLLKRELNALPADRLRALLNRALAAAAEGSEDDQTWGDVHRLELAHPFARLPLIGGRYAIDDLPAAGSRETLLKSAHGLVNGRHAVTYGSNARFLADMSSPDGAFAVLLGGQDGWLNSANFVDQIPLWRAARLIALPLSEAGRARAFPHVLRLVPADSGLASERRG